MAGKRACVCVCVGGGGSKLGEPCERAGGRESVRAGLAGRVCVRAWVGGGECVRVGVGEHEMGVGVNDIAPGE